MNKKELTAILYALQNAQDTIETLACENYPYTAFQDEDLRRMFYRLNDMCLTIDKKLEVIR